MNKGIAPIAIILIIIGVLVVAGGLYYYQTQTEPDIIQPSPTPSPQPDETADWQTYRNEEYEFEFKYPQNSEFSIEEAVFPGSLPEKTFYLVNQQRKFISINVIPSVDLTLLGIYSSDVYKRENKKINTLDWIIIEYTAPLPHDPEREGRSATTIFNGKSYQITCAIYHTESEDTIYYTEIFNQILSTFKFID